MEVPPKPTIDNLRHVVNNFPIIDNHAHNLIQPALVDTIPLETITSEAQGRALRDAFKSLPHLRVARQLRRLYECPDDVNWEELLAQCEEWLRTDPERLNQQCFQGVHALLIDDGLSSPDKVLPYHRHNRYTKAPSKRIVRIETVAERLMESLLEDVTSKDLDVATFFTDTWVTLTEEFERTIQEAVQDPDVAGFKTVICYRTGLDIEPDYERAARDVGLPFERYVERCVRKKKYRIERKALNDYLVLRTLEILSEETPRADVMSKPLQLHTGLGDKDIDLLKSNTGYLQPLVENYTNVPFVLLHSAYPYTREAGYLATVYKNVYLDIGEVFPMVSRWMRYYRQIGLSWFPCCRGFLPVHRAFPPIAMHVRTSASSEICLPHLMNVTIHSKNEVSERAYSPSQYIVIHVILACPWAPSLSTAKRSASRHR